MWPEKSNYGLADGDRGHGHLAAVGASRVNHTGVDPDLPGSVSVTDLT